MDPVILTIATLIVAFYALKGLLHDVGGWVRGRGWAGGSGRSGGRAGAGKAAPPGRYGPGAYIADLWYGQWAKMRVRREARMVERESGMPRTGRFARLKQRVVTWWDDNTTRIDDERQARAIRDGERLHTTRWQRVWARLTGQYPDAYPERQRGQVPEADRTPVQPEPGAGSGQRPATDPGHSPNGARPATAPRTEGNNQPAAGRRNQQEEPTMSEVTGLGTATQYTAAQTKAYRDATVGTEGFAASLAANGVSGTALDAARRAMELQQQTAAAWEEANKELERHQQVKEAYDANQGAGSKQFVTAE